MQGEDNVYVEIPIVKLDKIVVSNTEVHQVIDDSWKEQEEQWSKSEYQFDFDLFQETDDEYVQFKRSAQKEVVTLLKNLNVGRQLTIILVLLLIALGFSIQRSFILIDSMKTYLKESLQFLMGKTTD